METGFKVVAPQLGSYNGGKRGAGVYQALINHIPPHRLYVEPFLGGGAVMALKRPAEASVGIDLDPGIITAWKQANASADIRRLLFLNKDGIEMLRHYHREYDSPETFVYCDPPFLGDTRRSTRAVYSNEMQDHAAHESLLKSLLAFRRANIMISTYPNALYERVLTNWDRWDMQVMTRKGPSTQHVYQNYPLDAPLHDYSFAGRDYRERERIKRKVRRLTAALEGLPIRERGAILQAVTDTVTPTLQLPPRP